MNAHSTTALALAACLMAAPALAQVTLYEHDNYQGRTFVTEQDVQNLVNNGFNDRASSLVVSGRSWEVCDNSNFGGRCVVLIPGNYPSLTALGLNDRVSSLRAVAVNARVDDRRYNAPPPYPAQTQPSPPPYTAQTQPSPPPYPAQTQPSPPSEWRRRGNEKLFEANVTSARAVMGTPERRCWVEQEEVARERSNANVPGAVVGALLGGILGHQVGGGTGRDLATGVGVLGGAVVGSRVGGNKGGTTTRDVQRCDTTSNQRTPDYWDVSYRFRGVDHRVQMSHSPGDTITVNRQGEPRE